MPRSARTVDATAAASNRRRRRKPAIGAIAFSACLAYVSVVRADDTLSLVRDTRRARILERSYRTLGIAMLASPLVALVAERMLRQTSADRAASQGILVSSPAPPRTRVPGRIFQTAPLDRSVEELRRDLGYDAA